jgi:hypothetical protein
MTGPGKIADQVMETFTVLALTSVQIGEMVKRRRIMSELIDLKRAEF